MSYKFVAFDLDGTLTDPEHGLVEGFIYAFRKMGITNYGDRASLRRFIGPSLYEVWQQEFGLDKPTVLRAIETFREYYNIYGWWDNKVYPGIPEMLHRLREEGKTVFLATSKPEDTAKKVMSLFGLDKYFHFIGGASGDTRDKKCQVLEYSMREIGADPRSTVLVGDRMYDAEGAAICGVASIGVGWGHGTADELSTAGFTHLASTPTDVVNIVIGNR